MVDHNEAQEAVENDWVSGFLSSNQILIVDSQSSARTSLTATLIQMGAKRHRMSLVGTIEEARREIERSKPRILFCDYMIGKTSSLDLIQEQRKEYSTEADNCVFVLVTSNGSQSAVARAAEEDVDTYIMKPYSINMLRKSLNEALKNKFSPNDYLRTIALGKKELTNGAISNAIEKFEAAKKLSDLPTLACFYRGYSELMNENVSKADLSYREGLEYNKFHYKCLIGLFDLLMKQEKHEEAYDVVKKLAEYFPANPKRLTSVLRLAIMTNNYNDIESYYQIFKQIDERTDELTRYICSALSVAGKHYLGQNIHARAVELFNNVAVSCAGRIQYMRYAIEALANHQRKDEAVAYLKRFPAETRGTADYLVASLMVSGMTRPSGEVIQQARTLIQDGFEQPAVYRVLIHHSSKSGLKDSTDHLVQLAVKKWPEQADDFKFAAAA